MSRSRRARGAARGATVYIHSRRRTSDSDGTVHIALRSTAAFQKAGGLWQTGIPLPDITRAGPGYQRLVCILLLLGFGLRLVMLDRFRFHQDEALYSSWALHFSNGDPLFLTHWIDKPPLFIWLLGYWFQLVGASEAGARLLNIGISTLTIAVVAAIARQAWTASAGLLAAAAFALNPFAISYSPTAFTDPLFLLGGVCSVYAAQRRQPVWAGLCLGAAIVTKQQGVLFVPLALAVLITGGGDARAMLAGVLRLGGGLALAVLPVLYWDSLRWAIAPSPWDLGMRNFGALEIVSPALWLHRATRIAGLLWYLTASHVVWVILMAVLIFGVLHRRPAGSAVGRRNRPIAPLLVGWIGAYWAVHTVASLPLWDRYFLPIAAAFAILTGWAGGRALAACPGTWRLATVGLWIALLLPGAVLGARGEIPIGSDHGAYDGLREAFVWLESHSPPEAVLYHQALSWHLQFYLHEYPRRRGASPASEVGFPRLRGQEARWFANPVALADDAAKRPQRARFFVAPSWLPLRNWNPHLAARELELVQRHRAGNFGVYELMARSR